VAFALEEALVLRVFWLAVQESMNSRPPRLDRCDQCGAVLIERTLEQNDKYHAVCADIASQLDWPLGSGQKRPVWIWKQLLSAAYERAQGRATEVYPSLDGRGVDVVYWHSHRRGKKSMSELIEYSTAFAIDQGVILHDPEARLSLAQTLRERAGA
jgi:hypothetical protein